MMMAFLHSTGAAFVLAVHLAIMVVCAPLFAGLQAWTRARCTGNASPGMSARWSLIRHLMGRHAAPCSTMAIYLPIAALGCAAAAAALVPSFSGGMLGARLSDLLVIFLLLGTVRAAILASAFSGHDVPGRRAAQHEIATLPATGAILLVACGAIAMLTSQTGGDATLGAFIAGARGQPAISPSLAFIAAALCLLADAPGDGLDRANRQCAGLAGPDRATAIIAMDIAALTLITIAGDLVWPISVADMTQAGWILHALEGIFIWLARCGVIVIVLGALGAAGIPGGMKRSADAALLMAGLAVLCLFAGHF